MTHQVSQKQGSSLTIRQARAAVAMAQSGSVSDAAATSGVSRKTLHRWIAAEDATFRNEVARQRSIAVQTALGGISSACVSHAVATLIELLDCKSLSVRRGAARDLLDMAIRVTDLQQLEERLSTLEAMVEDRGRRGR